MEAVVNEFLDKGDVDGACHVLTTLNKSASPTSLAKAASNATLQLACETLLEFKKGVRSPQLGVRLVKAILHPRVTVRCLFGDCRSRVETTRLYHQLTLFVHPDKCSDPGAASALALVTKRREEYDSILDDENDDEASFSSSPKPSSSMKDEKSSSSPSVVSAALSKQGRSRTDMSSPKRSMKSRPPSRDRKSAELDNLMNSFKRSSSTSVRLRCDLSAATFEKDSSTPSSPDMSLREEVSSSFKSRSFSRPVAMEVSNFLDEAMMLGGSITSSQTQSLTSTLGSSTKSFSLPPLSNMSSKSEPKETGKSEESRSPTFVVRLTTRHKFGKSVKSPASSM